MAVESSGPSPRQFRTAPRAATRFESGTSSLCPLRSKHWRVANRHHPTTCSADGPAVPRSRCRSRRLYAVQRIARSCHCVPCTALLWLWCPVGILICRWSRDFSADKAHVHSHPKLSASVRRSSTVLQPRPFHRAARQGRSGERCASRSLSMSKSSPGHTQRA